MKLREREQPTGSGTYSAWRAFALRAALSHPEQLFGQAAACSTQMKLILFICLACFFLRSSFNNSLCSVLIVLFGAGYGCKCSGIHFEYVCN